MKEGPKYLPVVQNENTVCQGELKLAILATKWVSEEKLPGHLLFKVVSMLIINVTNRNCIQKWVIVKDWDFYHLDVLIHCSNIHRLNIIHCNCNICSKNSLEGNDWFKSARVFTHLAPARLQLLRLWRSPTYTCNTIVTQQLILSRSDTIAP